MNARTAESRVYVPMEDVQVRDSGANDGSYTVRGYAAIFNSLSLDLGGFREKLDPGAFTNVLARNPDVLGVWDHDTSQILGRTRNGTLELNQDQHGLSFWMRVAPTAYAADLRILLERGDVSQCSFMFTIERERYELVGAGADQSVVFTVEEVGELFDVTICGRGAYAQTDVALANMRASRFEAAKAAGRIKGIPGTAEVDADAEHRANVAAMRARRAQI